MTCHTESSQWYVWTLPVSCGQTVYSQHLHSRCLHTAFFVVWHLRIKFLWRPSLEGVKQKMQCADSMCCLRTVLCIDIFFVRHSTGNLHTGDPSAAQLACCVCRRAFLSKSHCLLPTAIPAAHCAMQIKPVLRMLAFWSTCGNCRTLVGCPLLCSVCRNTWCAAAASCACHLLLGQEPVCLFLFAAFVCLWVLLFLGLFSQFVLLCSQSMTRVGHTSRDTRHSCVSLRVHCQLSLATLHVHCRLCCCGAHAALSPLGMQTRARSEAPTSCTSPVAVQLKATSSNRLTMMLSKSYRASIMPCLIFVTFLFRQICGEVQWDKLWCCSVA